MSRKDRARLALEWLHVGRSAPRMRYLGWVGHRNLGDEITYQAVREYLRPVGISALPEFGGGIDRVVKRAVRRLPVVLGGGTLIGGSYLDSYATANAGPGAAVFGTGVVDPEFPHSYKGVAPEQQLGRWAAELHKSAVVGVRGPRSAEILGGFGLQVDVLGDPACYFVQEPSFWTPASGRRVALNVGHAFGRMWGGELRTLSKLVDIADAFKRAAFDVEFFVVWPQDLAVTRQIASEAGMAQAAVRQVYDSVAFFEAVRGVDVFVGLKLHAVALAVAAGVPTVCLEYQPKCRDFLASVGAEEISIRTDGMDISLVVDLVKSMLDGVLDTRRLEILRRMREYRSHQEDAGYRVLSSLMSAGRSSSSTDHG